MTTWIARGSIAAALVMGWMSQTAQASWIEARTDHFIVYVDGSEASARDFATKLERFDKGMRLLHKLPDLQENHANPLTVYVVTDQDAVRRLCGGRSDKNCSNVAGFYQGHADGSTAFTPRRSGEGNPLDLSAQAVLFHEYSHHFIKRNYAAAYPAWFIEGFAEFNATASFERDGSIAFGKPPLYRAYALLRGHLLPLRTILATKVTEIKPDDRSQFYGQGWLITHYLTFEESRKGQLAAYLKGINEGKRSIDAAEAAFGDLHKLDRDLENHLEGKISFVRLGIDQVPITAVKLRALTAGEAAVMPARMRSERGVDGTSAPLVVQQARLLAAPFPNDRGAQEALAEAEYDAGNDDLAEAAADRVLAVAPDDRVALEYKGRARLRRARKAKISDPKIWSDARGWLVKANRQEPDDAAPLLYFYESFLLQGVAPTANAVIGLERAYVLAPEDKRLTLLLARQYLRDDKLKEARAVLAPLAYDPHAAPDNRFVQLIALIDKDDKAALAAQLKTDDGKASDD
jgi:hypothetical protein